MYLISYPLHFSQIYSHTVAKVIDLKLKVETYWINSKSLKWHAKLSKIQPQPPVPSSSFILPSALCKLWIIISPSLTAWFFFFNLSLLKHTVFLLACTHLFSFPDCHRHLFRLSSPSMTQLSCIPLHFTSPNPQDALLLEKFIVTISLPGLSKSQKNETSCTHCYILNVCI